MQRFSGLAFEQILQKSSLKDIMSYFSFDRSDERYNNTRAFLATTAAQWRGNGGVVDAELELRWEMGRFHSQNAFTDEDLLILLSRIRSTYTDGQTVFVLDNIDECTDKLSSFWPMVAEVFESWEMPWKFLIFTKSVDSLDSWLKNWPKVALGDEFSFNDIDPRVEDEITYALYDDFSTGFALRPTMKSYKNDVMRLCDNDIGMAQLLLQDLRQCRSEDALTATLGTLQNMTTETLAKRAMDFIPEAKRDLVARAITWVLFAFRPLSIRELHSALEISEDAQVSGRIAMFSPLADVPIFDLSNSQEVRFQHAKLREIVLQCENEWYDVKATAHEMIAARCLVFLDTHVTHESLDALCTVQHDILSTPYVEPRTDLATYAICYWDQHYRLAPEKVRLMPQVLQFFQSKVALRQWHMARWFMSNPISRRNRTYLSQLPLIASIGLEDVYERWIEDENISPTDEQTWLPYAVAEAARNKHRSFVLRLLRSVKLDNTTATYILVAASSAGDEDILVDLMSHIRTSLSGFSWPAFLIRHASWSGHARVVQALADDGADLSGREGALWDQCSLHVAARNSQLEVVKLLVKYDQSLVHALDTDNTSPLYLATNRGNADLVRVLLENGAPANESADIPIGRACTTGSHAAVRILLEHGAEIETIREAGGQEPPLHAAVREGNYQCVQILLENHADPNHEAQGVTALQLASENDRIDMVRLLVEHGADVNKRRDENTSTALHEATQLKSGMAIVQYLVDKDADINLRTPSSSPLFAACLGKNADAAIVRLLLEKGANVNESYSDMWTPLHGAYESVAVTRLLLEAGALVDRVLEANGRSPLFLAAEWGQTDVVEALLEHNADVNLRYMPAEADYMSGFTPLIIALQEGHSGVVRLLLEAGADTGIKPMNDVLPITYAGTTDLLRMFLEFKPDLTLQDKDGDTPLNALMSRANIELADIKLLVYAGNDINTPNKTRRTVLLEAVSRDRMDIARFLLKRGAALDISAIASGTPLHLACWDGSVESVRLLVDAGADINIVAAFLGSPVQAACRRAIPNNEPYELEVEKTLDTLRCLSESSTMKIDVNVTGGLYGSALGAACYHSTFPVVQFLLNLGATMDTCDQGGRHPIHFAAVGQSTANFEAMRAANADLYARDKAGRTIVHCAVVSSRLDILQCVLQATDGLLDMADDDGWTPLHYAARGTDHRYSTLYNTEDKNERKHEIVTFLVDEGADVWSLSNGPDGKQWSPLKLANYHGAKQETLELLTPKIKTSAKGEPWDDELHKSQKGFEQRQFCDACFAVSISILLASADLFEC